MNINIEEEILNLLTERAKIEGKIELLLQFKKLAQENDSSDLQNSSESPVTDFQSERERILAGVNNE